MSDELSLDELEVMTGGAPNMEATLVNFAKTNRDVYNNLNDFAKSEVDLGMLSKETYDYLLTVYEALFKEQELTEAELEGVGMNARRM